MKWIGVYRVVYVFIVVALLSAMLFGQREARAFSAVQNLDLDTHGIILRGAWEQLSGNPVFKESRFPPINGILKFEGVLKEASDPFATAGGGPDVKGRTRDGEHYYNPKLKGKNRGGAPASVGRYYSILAGGMLGSREGVSVEQAAAWAAHFLSDMNVPYHVVGMPAGGAEAIWVGGIPGRTAHSLSPGESGPLWLKEVPPTHDRLWKLFIFDFFSKWPGWGTTQDFERGVAVFHTVRECAGSHRDFHDWFDPWYYNGWGAGIEPLQTEPVVHNSSHAKWEVWAHLYLTRWTNYKPSVNTRFHPQWKNGWVRFDDKVPWEAQQKQAEEFTKKAAEQTWEDMQQVYRSPDIAADDAIWRVMTLWRASISAMKPSMEVKRDIADPARHELRAIIDNSEKENVFDVKVRLTLTGDGSTFSEVKNVKGSIPASGKGDATFIIKPKDPAKCKVRLEVIGHYETTPDLQYAKVEESFNGIKRSADEAQNARLWKVIESLKQAAEKSERLAAQIDSLCLSSSGDVKSAEDDLGKLKTHVDSMVKQVKSVETAGEDIRQKAESIRQYHLNAEEGASNEGKVAHEAEKVSKDLCEAAKAIQNAQSREERSQLFRGMESTRGELRVFLTEGNSIFERVKPTGPSSKAALKELEALLRHLPGALQQTNTQVWPAALDKSLGNVMEKIKSAQEKTKELAGQEEEARKKYDEGLKLLASLPGTAGKDKVRSEMDGYMERLARARGQVRDCPEKVLTDLGHIRRETVSVSEAYARAQEAIANPSGANIDENAVKSTRDTVGLTEYLVQVASAYRERVRRACADGAFCFTLAEDAMKRPVYVIVPDVTGKHIDNAAGILKTKNFRPKPAVIGSASKKDLEFKVQSQYPRGDGKAEEGSPVTIRYYGQFNTRDAAANADCSRWQGSVGRWDAGKQRVVCVCPENTSWNATRASCVSARETALNNVNCMIYPGSVAVFNDRTQRAACECRNGLAWNRGRTGCVDFRTAALENADCSRFPGMQPVWNEQSGKAECFCPQGSIWDKSKGRCVSRQELDNYCNQIGARLGGAARANDIKTFRQILSQAQDCDFNNQALADLRNMEYNQQLAMMNQMANAMGAMMGATRLPQQRPPAAPPVSSTGTLPVRPPPPTVTPARSPTGATTQTATVKPPQTAGGGKIDCDKKYCPICGNDNVDLLRTSVSQQCMDCRKRFAAQIADCNRGGRAAATPAATVEQFKNHYVMQCIRQKWNADTKRYETVTIYAVYGPGKQYPSGRCRKAYGPDTESQCNMRADTWSRPRFLR